MLALAFTAGMLGAVNPCGFALLPAYLSVLVAGDPSRSPAAAVGRAVRCTAALTLGYVAVFGTFGLLLAPLAGWLQPRLPWLTVALGLGLAVAGGWLLAGRSLPSPGNRLRAPELTGSLASMVLFGMAYAVASLGCAVGPFLAIVVTGLSTRSGPLLFLAYAAGMGLVIGVTAIAVALVRVSVLARLRRAAALVPRLGGAILVVAGAYLAYYGRYELRLARDLRAAGTDPVVNAAGAVQRELSAIVGGIGVLWWLLALVALVGGGFLLARRPGLGGGLMSGVRRPGPGPRRWTSAGTRSGGGR